MLKVREYSIDPTRSWIVLGIHDGWKPLTPRRDPSTGVIILPALVDDEKPEDQEVVRLVRPGEDLYERTEGVDAAYLGEAGGLYLFLDLPAERPVRRISHPALVKEALERQTRNSEDRS